MPITQLIIRLFIAFITLLVLTRLMGRKEISQMTFLTLFQPYPLERSGPRLPLTQQSV